MQGFRPYDLTVLNGIGEEEKLVKPALPPIQSKPDLIRAARKSFRIPHPKGKGPLPPVWGVESEEGYKFPLQRKDMPKRVPDHVKHDTRDFSLAARSTRDAVDSVYSLVRSGLFDPLRFSRQSDRLRGFSKLECAMLHGAIGGTLVAIGREDR